MDKWKELELNKMKSGGNNQAKEFLEAQSDWKAGGNISANYNSKAAALYRDKVTEGLKKNPRHYFCNCRYPVRQKGSRGAKRHLLPGTTSRLTWPPPPRRRAPHRNQVERRGAGG